MLILLIAALPNILENVQCEQVCQFGIGNNIRHYNINNLCSSLKSDVCKALLFFHPFTGCDTTSTSFCNHSKLKFFDVWMKDKDKDNITSVFNELCNEPNCVTENHVNVLEKFLLSVYFPRQMPFEGLDYERMKAIQANRNSNLRSIPISRNDLKEHKKRSCLQSGWSWKKGKKNIALQNVLDWEWRKNGDRLVPKWQPNENNFDAEIIMKTCSCSNACKNCRCRKNNVKCVIFCKCQGKCLNNSNL